MHMMALGQATPGHELEAPGPQPEIALGQFGAEYEFAAKQLRSAVDTYIGLATGFLEIPHKTWLVSTTRAAIDALKAFNAAAGQAMAIANERFDLLEWTAEEIEIMVVEARGSQTRIDDLTIRIDEGILLLEDLIASAAPEDQTTIDEWFEEINRWIAQVNAAKTEAAETTARIDIAAGIVQEEQSQHAAYVQALAAAYEDTHDLSTRLHTYKVLASAHQGDELQKAAAEAARRDEESIWEQLERFVAKAGTTFLWILGGVAGLSVIFAITTFLRRR